jgi:hypothetical protein
LDDIEWALINRLVDASVKPLSVIIIGVGQADFGAFFSPHRLSPAIHSSHSRWWCVWMTAQMNELDADEKTLESGGKKAQRDIVQFVPMRNFSTGHISKLSSETLAEVPKQLLGFAKLHNIQPMPPRAPQLEVKATMVPTGGPPPSFAGPGAAPPVPMMMTGPPAGGGMPPHMMPPVQPGIHIAVGVPQPSHGINSNSFAHLLFNLHLYIID